MKISSINKDLTFVTEKKLQHSNNKKGMLLHKKEQQQHQKKSCGLHKFDMAFLKFLHTKDSYKETV